MYSLEKFEKSDWSLAAVKNKIIIFQSKSSGLKPLIKLIKKFSSRSAKLVVYDKIIGQAAALLLAYLKVSQVYTPLISQAGVLVLKKHHIEFEAKKRVKHIMDFASQELCHWEKLAKNKTPKKFWLLVKSL